MTTPAMCGVPNTAPGLARARVGAHRDTASRLPSPGVALTTAVAAGAALGALHGAHLSGDDLDGGHLSTIAAELHLRPAPAATPVPAATGTHGAHDAASDAVPELAKSAHLARQSVHADAAVDRFMSHVGSTQYENWCERAVENAYGTQGHYASAIEDWQSQHQHSDWQHAPRGALVFYDTSSDGHVALSLGDGRVVSSSAHHQVGVVPVGYFQHPLGWAPAPY